MSEWTAVLCDPPALTALEGGSGRVVGLRIIANLNITVNLHDVTTVEFDLPLDHYQTALIQHLVSDLLLQRDDEYIQRFRCTAVTDSSANGVGTVHYTFSSYRGVVDWWMFHDGDVLNYATAEQTAVAWSVLNEGQGKPFGNIEMSRGTLPGASVNVTAAPASGTFFLAGESRGKAIESKLANVSTGFEWDVEPDPSFPQTRLVFNTWNIGTRNLHGGFNSPLVLTEGSMQDWSRARTATAYANVFRASGGIGPYGGTLTPVYVPSSGDPTGTPVQGRWETNTDASTMTTGSTLAAFAAQQAALASDDQEAWTCVLAPGHDVDGVPTPYWLGKAHCWVGDTVRLVLVVDAYDDAGVLQPNPYISIDAPMRVWQMQIAVNASTGAEVVSMTLNRLPSSYTGMPANLPDRVANLEREPRAAATGQVTHLANFTSLDTWTFNHGLGYIPGVTLYNAAGNQILGTVTVNTATTTTVVFAVPVTGSMSLS